MLIPIPGTHPVRPRSWRFTPVRSVLAGFLVFTMALGCASVTPPVPQTPAQPDAAGKVPSATHGWFAARFKIRWLEGASPAWHMDDLIAYEVVAPALERHREQIVLWRFHRRAAPDQTGHQFSFIFYATPGNAEAIYTSIRSNPVLAFLKSQGLVLQDGYADTTKVEQPNIEDTADSRWSLPLKRSWPNFIMGVSEAWLILISEFAGEKTRTGRTGSPKDLVVSYEKVHHAVEKTWQEEGGHALLHHLNALFGYAPVSISGNTHLMRF